MVHESVEMKLKNEVEAAYNDYPVSNQIMKKITRDEVFRQKKFHCYDTFLFKY